MACLLLLDFILYIVYMLLVVFYLWLLGFLLSLLIWTFSQKQAGIAKPDRLRKQMLYDDSNEVLLLTPPFENKTEPYEPDQEKLETAYLLQLEGHEQTFQCFAVRYLTEEFIQVDPLQLDAVQGLYVDVDGTPEEIEEQDRLENVQFNSLTESDIDDDDEIHQQVMSIDIPSDTPAQNGHRDDRAQALSELLRIRTINIQQGPSILLEHAEQSEYINSSGADDNVSASNYEEDSRREVDNQVAETEPPNVERVRPTTQTDHLETNVAPRMQHEPQVHGNVTVDVGDTESSVSNFVPYDIASTSLMSMSTGTVSSNFSSISSEDNETFAFEWLRLKTFSDWPLTSIFSTTLARNGWVSLGEGDRARCYSCHVVHEGWRIGDDPDHYHSPNCRFKDGQSNNVPIAVANFHPTPTLGQVSLLSTQGDGSSDNNPGPVQGELQPGLNRPQHDSLSKETSSLPQETEIFSVVNNGNQNWIPNQQPEPPNGPPIRLKFGSPKYPWYASPAVRISSYTDWPSRMAQTPSDMAHAGFFYSGDGDCTRCYFCGGGLRNWEAGDDPWVEHARWLPRCPFIRQIRGQEFIDLVQKRVAELENQEELESQQRNPPDDTDPSPFENHSNADSLLNSNVDELSSLKQENSSLKDQILCKICMEKNVSIAFLPCGHLACCEDCAPAMRKCPMCRKFVKGTVKTFLV